MFNQPFKHYLVLDFESTCQEGVRIDPQEIIEFPCLLVGADDLCLVDQVPSFTLLPCQVFPTPISVPRVREACGEAPVDRLLHCSHRDHPGYD